ncbi:MAG: SDR family oxidoreductase, partial [Gammaproteobacteria bacterium]
MSSESKVVLVTGAGRPNGIGAGIAKCFTEQGDHVVVTDLSDQHFTEIQALVSEDTMCLVADAADQGEMQLTVNRIVERFGRLDVLVNNAGIGG